MPKKENKVLQALIDYKDPIVGSDLAKLTGFKLSTIHNAISQAIKRGHNIAKTPDKTHAFRGRGGRAPVFYQYIGALKDTPIPSGSRKIQAPAVPACKNMSPTLTERCYHYIKARHVTTTSHQIADFFNISNDQAISLIERVAAQHESLSLSVSVKVLQP